MQKFLTPNEVAELLHVHPQTVYKWIRKGRIRAVRFASRWTIPQSAIVGGTAYTPAIGRALRIRRIDRHDTRRPVHVAARITAPHDLPVDPQAGKPAALRSSARYAVAEIVDAITALLAGHDWLTQRQIRDMLGGNVAAMSVKWALNYLVQRAIVERDPPEKKQGATYKYRLASRNGGPELTTPKGGAEEVKSGDPEPGNFTSPLGEAVEVKSGNLETGNFMSPMHIKSGEC
jgi:excisionase family DNA binding protein